MPRISTMPVPISMRGYGGRAASIDLDGLVAEWTRLHREELEANWERARREEPLEQIVPLP